jgi:hypothetical protein
MAISLISQPFDWMVRGQKLMIVATSTETSNPGFRYGVDVTIGAKVYSFYVSAAPDGGLYFDIQPLVDDIRNYDPLNWHFETDDTQQDFSFKLVDCVLTEWWTVDGVFTLNEGSEFTLDEKIAINGYYQVLDGMRPNPMTGNQNVKYSLTNNTSYAMSDRKTDTHNWKLAQSWGVSPAFANLNVWIPVFESDYGLLSIPGNNTYLTNNAATSLGITMRDSSGAATPHTIPLNGYRIEALPVYPANLNAWAGLPVRPSLFPDWRYYQVRITSGPSTSIFYNFYNAGVYGQVDCRYERIRLGWVNSRGGWDYFNFIKKSEKTNEIDRKKYRKVLYNGEPTIFEANDRGLVERRNIVEQVLTINSDFIQQGEFTLLRSLLVSNQVVWLTSRNGSLISVPVNVDDSSYVEKNTSDGKLYNVSLKIRMANEYWT